MEPKDIEVGTRFHRKDGMGRWEIVNFLDTYKTQATVKSIIRPNIDAEFIAIPKHLLEDDTFIFEDSEEALIMGKPW